VFLSLGYDRDGNLRMVCSRHPASSLGSNDYFEHRARYSALNPDGAVLDYARDVGVAASCASTNIPVEHATYQYDARHEMLHDANKTYTYDSSGNRLTTRDGNVLEDSLLYTPGSNRLWKSFKSTGTLDKTFEHDGNGSRHIEVPSCGTCDWRLYYYNSLGQQTGHKFFSLSGQWLGGPLKCFYDPLGRRVQACDDGSSGGGYAGFDGENVIRLTATTPVWRYVHGPGLDDPLVAMYEVGGGAFRKHYYLTDGRGRHLAFTDSVGTNYEGDVTYFQNGGNQAGSIGSSNGFANTRGETPSAPQLSFYRNRYYDQQTGRFTQEDPIGIAGGANLYAYSGNNPVTFTDPFGLCTDKDGKELPKEQCRDVTSDEGTRVYDKAVESGAWTYCKDPAQKDVPNQKGDCTDYVGAAMDAAGLPHLSPTVRTGDFAGSDDFRVVDPSKETVQAGDVVVQGGHAGVLNGQRDGRGRLTGTQNGKSGTQVIPWGKGVRGLDPVEPVIYRRQVPRQ